MKRSQLLVNLALGNQKDDVKPFKIRRKQSREDSVSHTNLKGNQKDDGKPFKIRRKQSREDSVSHSNLKGFVDAPVARLTPVDGLHQTAVPTQESNSDSTEVLQDSAPAPGNPTAQLSNADDLNPVCTEIMHSQEEAPEAQLFNLEDLSLRPVYIEAEAINSHFDLCVNYDDSYLTGDAPVARLTAVDGLHQSPPLAVPTQESISDSTEVLQDENPTAQLSNADDLNSVCRPTAVLQSQVACEAQLFNLEDLTPRPVYSEAEALKSYHSHFGLHNEAPIKIVRKPKNPSRRWDRKNFCVFCHNLVTNFCRHLVRWHPTEKEVIEFTRITVDNVKERKKKKQQITDELRRRGNFLYNSSKPKDSEFLPTRRLRNGSNEEKGLQFVSCRFCLGMFSRKTFYRHSKKCLKRDNPEDLDHDLDITEIVFGKTRTHGSWKKDGIVMLPLSKDEPHVVAFKKNIAPIINKDEFGVIALNDPLIIAIGSHFFMNHSDLKDRYNCTKKLRDAAKLLKICRSDEDIINFSDCFKPSKFNIVMSAVHELCGVNSESGIVNVVGMPARLSYVIQEGASILTCEIISNHNLSSGAKEILMKEINDFITLLKHKWKYMVSTNAEKSRKKKLSLKQRLLPDDEDIKVVATKIKSLELHHYNSLTLNLTAENYEMLCKLVIAHMIILNRRRSGEVARAELQYYLNRPPQEELSNDVLQTLTEEERNTLPLLTVFMVPGKLVHSVPILMTEQMKKSVDLIISCRLPLKIPKSNPLLFARTCTDRPFDGSKIIKDIRLTCNLKKPDHMTATGLRHHIATKSQIYGGEKYTENVCQFLGHTSNIHKQNYRLPLQAIQRGQIGSKLLQMEGSITHPSEHQTKEPNCNTTVTSFSNSTSYSEVPPEVNPEQGSDSDFIPEKSSEDEEFIQIHKKKTRSVTSRRKWLDEEKKVVLDDLGHCIKENKTPGMSKCLSVLRKHTILAGRTWSQINVFINNCIRGKIKLPHEYSHLLK